MKRGISIWLVFGFLTCGYGAECLVAYGGRGGFALGWHLAWPFFLGGGILFTFGTVVEIINHQATREGGERGNDEREDI